MKKDITVTETCGTIEMKSANRTVMLTTEEAYSIYEFMRKKYFHSFFLETIDYAIDDNDIDLNKFDGTKEEFTEEILYLLQMRTCDDVESATEQQIIDAVIDTAESYDIFS